MTNIVWLKRDLRTQDHEPFKLASDGVNNIFPIYIFDPEIIKKKDFSNRHFQFIYNSILDINQTLKKFNIIVTIFYGSTIDVFQYLNRNLNINKVFSYNETNNLIHLKKNNEIKIYFKKHNIPWELSSKNGVVSNIVNRKNWDKKWYTYANDSLIENKFRKQKNLVIENPFIIPDNICKKLQNYPQEFQLSGETKAWEVLNDFVNKRSQNYSKNISSPLYSRYSCSRISTYLAWGNVSIRQVFKFVKNNDKYNTNKRNLNSFLIRLKWNSHFVQKFHVEPRYQNECINRGYENLERTNKIDHLNAWKNASTGFPFIDACMKSLIKTGWLNFRMRAMLVSFLCHHLDTDWRLGANFLARQFLDYEPGIHYTQFQMQAGTTGINTLRIYNPVKQSQDQDPEGLFIKEWLPELRDLNKDQIHEPWIQNNNEQNLFFKNNNLYCKPIIDHIESGRLARKKNWSFKKNLSVKKENKRMVLMHTRNN